MKKIKTSKGQTVAWVLLVGVWCAILSAVLGAVACLTIVGIPVGIKQFKFIKLIFTTDDVAVAYRPDAKHRFYGLYWYAFGGVLTKLLTKIIFTVLGVFDSAAPLVARFEKISSYVSCPFDVEYLENGQYSENGTTIYDYKLLQRRIYKSPTTAIFDEQRGKLITVRRYLKNFEGEAFAIKRNTLIVSFLFFALIIFGSAFLLNGGMGLIVGSFLCSVGFIGCVVTSIIQTSQYLKLHDVNLKKLFDLYDDSDPYDITPVNISLCYVFDRLYKDREERKRAQNTRRNS